MWPSGIYTVYKADVKHTGQHKPKPKIVKLTADVPQTVQKQIELPTKLVPQYELTGAKKAVPSRNNAESELESQLRPMKDHEN